MLAEQAAAAIGGEVVVLLPDGTDIEVAAAAPTPEPLDPSAIAAARWAWERGEAAGHGAGTLPQARWTFRPLDGLRSRAGVAGIEAGALRQGSDEECLVLALLKQGAVAIERARLAGDAVETETLKRTDRFRGALTNSVSRDLRTPLSTVLGSATTLIDYGDTLKPAVIKDALSGNMDTQPVLTQFDPFATGYAIDPDCPPDIQALIKSLAERSKKT